MTDINAINAPWAQSSEIADDASVLITIATSEAEGMIRRWGAVASAIGDLSVEAVIRGAVSDSVLEVLREQRPQQYESEREVTQKIRAILDSGYRVFVRDADDPIDSARAAQVAARTLLTRGHPEYQTSSFYVLHLALEPFGAPAVAARHDDAGAARISDALRREMAAGGNGSGDGAAPEVAAMVPQDTGDAAAPGSYLVSDAEPAALVVSGESATEMAEAERQAADQAQTAQPVAASAPVEEEEIAPSVAAAAPAPVSGAKKHATKTEALMEQFRAKVAALDFRGLFVGNFGFQRDTVVDVSKLSGLSPQTVSAYLMKANALRQSGEHEKALSYYRVLLKSDPDNADYRFLYGKTLMEMGRVQPARECFERARQLGHESAALELERLESRQAKKAPLAFLQFWRRAETKH